MPQQRTARWSGLRSLVAEPVVREMAPGFKAHLSGYNGQSPGPTIDVVEGDRVRIFVTTSSAN